MNQTRIHLLVETARWRLALLRWRIADRVSGAPAWKGMGAALVLLLAAGSVAWLQSSRTEGSRPSTVAARAPLPVLPRIPARFEGEPLSSYLEAPAISEDQRDELLASSVLNDPDFTRAVHGWVDYWESGAREWFPGFLERMSWLGPSVDSALAARGFPPSLRYLPLIESGYDPRVTSRASAAGLWQLMTPTARDLDLEVGPLLDERRHPIKSTDAALRYLADLKREFESWHLALAAYNWGPTRVRRVLRRHARGQPRTDSLFWALRARFPRETREFVPKLYGAMWVASRPESYGYPTPSVEPLSFELVHVPDLTSLGVVALTAGVEVDEVLRLNPEYVRQLTPPDRAVTVRLPPGRPARTFSRIYPRLVPQERVNAVRHVVGTGETLSTIAARYGVGSAEIDAANPHVRRRGIRIGERLVVPVATATDGS